MDPLLLMFLSVWFAGSVLLAGTYWLTRRIRSNWLRQTLRALLASLTFTPSLLASGHVGVVSPAIVAFYWAVLNTTTEWPVIARSVMLPLAVAFGLLWSIAVIISILRNRAQAS
jgi:hypothetical protein